MAARPDTIEVNDLNDIPAIVGDLTNALDRLDSLGLTDAGLLLARTLDSLAAFVSDSTENPQAIRS